MVREDRIERWTAHRGADAAGAFETFEFSDALLGAANGQTQAGPLRPWIVQPFKTSVAMHQPSSYYDHDALALAELVRSRRVSSVELLQEAKERLSRHNHVLNAVVCPMYSLADNLVTRTDVAAPFCGVPFLVKDLMLPFAGFPTSNGSVALKKHISGANSEMANRIIQVGLIPFGKTNTSELGTSSLTAPHAFGETKNPWNTDLNSGGSSGGSSAAVSARIVPMAYSSDGGGSIRLPASYCGVFGLKPSSRLNLYEDMSRAWNGAVASHVTTVSVRDSAAYLDVMTTSANARYSTAAPSESSYLHSTLTAPPRLKIALITQSPTNTPVHWACIAAARTAAECCEQLGHHVEIATWNFDGVALMRAFLTIVLRCTARDVAYMAQVLGIQDETLEIELSTRFMATVGAGIGADRMATALEVWRLVGRRMADLHQKYDVVLTPTAATPPLTSAALRPGAFDRFAMQCLIYTQFANRICFDLLVDSMIHKSLYATPFTPIANVTGQPAMSVPLFWDDRELPHGAHFMASVGNDRLLFQLAAQLESALPWNTKMPRICR